MSCTGVCERALQKCFSTLSVEPDTEAACLFVCFPTELPSLLPIVDVAEALLHVKNGAWFLCLLVANVPDSFNEGITSLIWSFLFSLPPPTPWSGDSYQAMEQLQAKVA